MTDNRYIATGFFLIALPTGAFIISTIGFMCGIAISPWVFPLAVLAATLATGACCRQMKSAIRIAAWICAAIAAACLICAVLSDHSYDGNFYHQEGVALLAKGWNPVYMRIGPSTGNSIWVEHYAKFLEITEATLVALTGSIEASKAINLILLSGCAFILTGTLQVLFPSLSGRRLAVCVSMLMANPVCLLQAFTFYNDYALYLELVIITCAFGLIFNHKDTTIGWITAAMATVIAINTKFTHFFYIGLAWAVMLAWCMAAKRARTTRTGLAVGAAALLAGAVITGFHPYVTNTLHYGNPLFPLLGANSTDIMTDNTPLLYNGHSRLTNLLTSLTTNGIDILAGATIGDSGLAKTIFFDFFAVNYDARINGFGPLFVICLGASLLYAAFFIRKRWIWAFIILITCSTFIFEQSWWARYVPFLWAIPGTVILGGYLYAPHRAPHKVRTALVALCISLTAVSDAFFIASATGVAGANTLYRQRLFEALRSNPVPVKVSAMQPQHMMTFDNEGIITETVPVDSLDYSRCVTYYGQWVTDGSSFIVELPREHVDELTDTTTMIARILQRKICLPYRHRQPHAGETGNNPGDHDVKPATSAPKSGL